jgi:beta-lactamase regulating signal transducer with metallopeptidase domain
MERILIEYIANACWQLPLLAAGAWLLLRAIHATPQWQHGVWLAVLVLAVLLPARGIGGPLSPAGPEQPAARKPVPQAAELPSLAPLNRAAPPRWRQLPSLVRRVHIAPALAHGISGLYVAALLFGIVRLVLAWSAAQHLAASPTATLSPRNMAVFQNCARKLSVKLPQLRESALISTPVTIGVVRPVLLLPLNFGHHTADQIQAVLCHELAHIRRHDCLVNLLCQVAALPVAGIPSFRPCRGASVPPARCSAMRWLPCRCALRSVTPDACWHWRKTTSALHCPRKYKPSDYSATTLWRRESCG